MVTKKGFAVGSCSLAEDLIIDKIVEGERKVFFINKETGDWVVVYVPECREIKMGASFKKVVKAAKRHRGGSCLCTFN